nr:nucleotidyltransferase domain-containing protein [Gammaproteobacteria bacterium]
MRLTQTQIQLVKDAVTRHFGATARVFLFGSRLDDARQGGDFDFYVETDMNDPATVIDRKLALLAQLHATPAFEGEKIDLIIKPALPGPYPPIYQVARREGVSL